MKQILPDDVVVCDVYTRLALINNDARLFHDLEIEELNQRGVRDNATLIDSVRNLTNQPVHGLQTQLRTARRRVLGTPPRGGMCVRIILQTVGRLDPVLRNLEGAPVRYRNGRQRHRRQLWRARKMVRALRELRGILLWQQRVRSAP